MTGLGSGIAMQRQLKGASWLRASLVMVILFALLAVPALAQDGDNPKVAIIRFGPFSENNVSDGAILDVLESYGFISTAENNLLEGRQDYDGENLTIIWGDAGFDLPTLNLIMDGMLDQDVDAIVASGSLVALAAINATMDMEEPTPVLFMNVSAPYGTGIADAPCVKPAHATGSRSALSYDYVLATLQMQDPDISVVGTIFNSSEAIGSYGADEIAELGAELGITVESAGVISLADLRPAANGLVEKGVQAIILPLDSLVTQGLPVITAIANEAGIPVFHPSFSSIGLGATIGAGSSPHYQQGSNAGIMLAAFLNGELDIAATGIVTSGELAIGVNLDSAADQGVEISEAVLEEAAAVIEDGRPTKLHPEVLAAIARRGVIIPLEQRAEDDAAWLAALQCTDEMIARQQAELDAASE